MTGEVPAPLRPYRKLLLAVAGLHSRGHQRLRIVPYLYDLGTWRCTLLPAMDVSRTHGARWAAAAGPVCAAHYTSADGNDYWGWRDASDAPPERLATAIQERFPELMRLSHGPDASYARWYAEMLELTHPDGLPISWDGRDSQDAFASHMGTIGLGGVAGRFIPLPPPGHFAGD